MEEWMRRQILTLLGAGLIGLMHPMAAQATLLDFTFSFTGTAPPGTAAGTVTGEIFGLTVGATSAATNVVVTSFPAGLELPSPPLTFFSNPSDNSFTVSAMGQITAATYEAGGATNDFHGLNLPVSSIEFLSFLENISSAGLPLIVENSVGDSLAGVTFTPVQPIPEPSSVTLLGIGLGVAALWQLRQKRRRQRWLAA
jgi:PEP-CTERM motif